MTSSSTIDPTEAAKFAQHAQQWWDLNGPLKTLHDINPTRLEFVEKNIELTGKRVLDVGCGGGVFSEAMAQRGALVTGLDVVPEAIASAAVHAKHQNLNIEYGCQSIETYEAEAFDVITCMEMLEHTPEPADVIFHCARLLKPGGWLMLSTINRTPKAYAMAILAAEYVLRLLPRQTHDYDKFLKPSELAGYVRKAGLSVSQLSGMDYNPFTRTSSLIPAIDVNYLIACRK